MTKVTSTIDAVEDKIESTFNQITNKVDDVKKEVEGVEEKVHSAVEEGMESVEDKMKEMKSKATREEEIDELLASLPDGEEVKAELEKTADDTMAAATGETDSKDDEGKD